MTLLHLRKTTWSVRLASWYENFTIFQDTFLLAFSDTSWYNFLSARFENKLRVIHERKFHSLPWFFIEKYALLIFELCVSSLKQTRIRVFHSIYIFILYSTCLRTCNVYAPVHKSWYDPKTFLLWLWMQCSCMPGMTVLGLSIPGCRISCICDCHHPRIAYILLLLLDSYCFNGIRQERFKEIRGGN